jgi:outer membrane lipoprotein carrier protein
VAAFALSATTVDASGLAQLKSFVEGAKSGRTAFRQSVVAKGAREPQVSTGTFTFSRPGRFRWAYEKPFEQLIVGDGAKLWIYDRDLNQVITHKQDAALGASPAALLSGDNALDRNFDVVDAGGGEGLEFVDARPRAPESGVERVRIGFRDNLPRTMELRDTFGNVTTLTFDAFERNARLDPAQFAFVPPKGADVVGN